MPALSLQLFDEKSGLIRIKTNDRKPGKFFYVEFYRPLAKITSDSEATSLANGTLEELIEKGAIEDDHGAPHTIRAKVQLIKPRPSRGR